MLSRIQVGGGVRNFWRGVREKGGSDEPPLVTGLCISLYGIIAIVCGK